VRDTKPFLCSYQHDGAQWSVTIYAYDWADAEARVKKLGYLRLDGEIAVVMPQRLGWAAKALCTLKNMFK